MARIIVIDDERLVRDAIAKILSAAGHAVSSAGNGAEGIRLHTADPADLIITDLVMPEMDGIELLSRLRRATQAVPIIAISGEMNRELYLRMAASLGAFCTLTKPFTPAQLLAFVAKALGTAITDPSSAPELSSGEARA